MSISTLQSINYIGLLILREFQMIFSSLWLVFSSFFAYTVIFYSMSDIVSFTVLDAEWFCILTSTLELCSETWLSYLELV